MLGNALSSVAVAAALFPRLFRLLLCAMLVLNGIGSAVAGTRMAVMSHHDAGSAPHAAMPMATSSTPVMDHASADALSDCADHASNAAANTVDMPQDAPHGDGDCLQACIAMCMHHCHAMPVFNLSLAVAVLAPPPLQRDVAGHRFVPSPPPIRPPIA